MRSGSRRRAAIIGGGITGLAAAHRLLELASASATPLEIALYESSARAGGAIETIRTDGCVIETGADSFLSEKPWALALAERMGLSGEVIGTQARWRKTFVVRRGRLMAIPEGFSLLAPAFIWPLLKSPLFSPAGKARILLEPLIPRRVHDGDNDESLADFVTRRMGREVLDRVAQPLAGGIYTADPAMLSVKATMPRFVEMEKRHGSLIRGLRAAARTAAEARGGSGARWSLFVSFKNGAGALIDALAARLGDSIRYDARVIALERPGDGAYSPRWRLRFADGSAADADTVVCAAPAYAIAPLLAPHHPELAAMLTRIGYASAATVNMAFRESDFPRFPGGFGFVAPIKERRRIIAGSFSSLKFAGRAPDGMILTRVFLGGALQTEIMELDDAAMLAAARAEFASLLGVTAEPALAYVRRWPEAMPQYAVGHLARAAQIERAAEALDGVQLAGAYLRGVGIPDCVHSGESAAEAAFTYLTIDRQSVAIVEASGGKMTFKEILSRIIGLSCPVFGVSWNPPEAERDVARRIIASLEDRRVLFSPSEMEVPYHCIESVLKIRLLLTSEISKLNEQSELSQNLRAMRSACRKFLHAFSGARGDEIVRYGAHKDHWANWHFNGSIGELRGVFGIQIARIAASYGLDVEDDLSSILPEPDRDEGGPLDE